MKGMYVEITKADLYREYKLFCEESNDWPCSQNRFGRRMLELGYKERHAGHTRFWKGVGLLSRNNSIAGQQAR